MCPVCTLAVGAGLGLSRWLGVDDAISGVWIGALILSSSLWFIDWLKKKYPKLTISHKQSLALRAQPLIIIPIMYAFVLLPLAWTGIIIDKLIVGVLIGSLAFLLGTYLDKKIRTLNGKPLFNFQKVVFPVALLLISSLIIWIITKH